MPSPRLPNKAVSLALRRPHWSFVSVRSLIKTSKLQVALIMYPITVVLSSLTSILYLIITAAPKIVSLHIDGRIYLRAGATLWRDLNEPGKLYLQWQQRGGATQSLSLIKTKPAKLFYLIFPRAIPVNFCLTTNLSSTVAHYKIPNITTGGCCVRNFYGC